MNYGTLKALAKKYLETDEASFNTYIAQFVKQAEDEIYRRIDMPEQSKTVAINYAPSIATVQMPINAGDTFSDFRAPNYVTIVDNGEYKMLLNKDQSFLREYAGSQTGVGTPRYYTVFSNGVLMVTPTPDKNYDGEICYNAYPASITKGDDAGTTWLSENAENALLFGTVLQGYVYLKGDESVIASYKEKFEDAVATLGSLSERNDRDSYR